MINKLPITFAHALPSTILLDKSVSGFVVGHVDDLVEDMDDLNIFIHETIDLILQDEFEQLFGV